MLKIDRSFVRGLPEGRAARTLVNAIMYLAEGFGLTVVAEGVETEAQRDFLLEARLPVRAGLPVLAAGARRGGPPSARVQYASRPNFSRRRW